MGGCLEDALVHICTTCQYKILCMHDDGYCTLQDILTALLGRVTHPLKLCLLYIQILEHLSDDK